MNENELINENKDKSRYHLQLLKSAMTTILENNKKLTNQKSNKNNLSRETILKDLNINNLMNSIRKFEKIFNSINKSNSLIERLFKRYTNYRNQKNSKILNTLIKNIKKSNNESMLGLFISLLKIYINKKRHEKIKQVLLLILRFSLESKHPCNYFSIIIEILFNIFIEVSKGNPNSTFNLEDEPFIILIDIINALIIYQKYQNLEKDFYYLLEDVIDLFDKYLIAPYYLNISFNEASLWLKLLEIYMINASNQNQINSNPINSDNKANNFEDNNKNIQKKLFCFLGKIYKFSLKDEYFQNYLISKSIINLQYYNNLVNFLIYLINEEAKLKFDSSFKIINGIKVKKEKFLFLPNFKIKLNEYSIIFSFNITHLSKEAEKINILNINNKPANPVLNIYIDKNEHLTISYNNEKLWNTLIKIKENKFYLVCISPSKKLFGSSKLHLFINETIDEKFAKYESAKGTAILGDDACNHYRQKCNSLEFPKEIFIELGKSDFIGVLGDLYIINKNLNKENIHHLFNLKENYSMVLSKLYNNYNNLTSSDEVTWNKTNLGINKSTEEIQKSIEFFKQLSYEIKLEIITYTLSKFTKYKYLSNNFSMKELLEGSSKQKNVKENNQKSIYYININQNSSKSSNRYKNTTSISNSSFTEGYVYNKDIIKNEKIDINSIIFKFRYTPEAFFQNKGIEFLTLQLYNIFSIIEEDKQMFQLYFFETLDLIHKIMVMMNADFIEKVERKPPKLNNNISIFFLSLLNLVNLKNNTFFLTHDIVLKFLEILDYFRNNQLFIQRNLILNILLDVRYYPNPSDITKYPELLKIIISDLNNDANNDSSLIKVEILYKILMLDFIFESKESDHKLLMELISAFICFNKGKKNNSDLEENIMNEFITYILRLKNDVKLYHYLKIIYLNVNKIKNKLLNNETFLSNINMKMEKTNSSHCKYCEYNQMLWYLVYEEIIIKSSTQSDDYCFHYNPNGFMKNPGMLFVKCVFAQCLNISNENKLKYIKNKSDGIQFINSLKTNEKKDKKIVYFKNTYAELVEYNKFIPKFNALNDYIKFLFSEHKESKDIKLLNIIKNSIDFIGNFLKVIYSESDYNLKNKNYSEKSWSIVNKDSINAYENHSKKIKIIKKYNDYINELLSCTGIKTFYYIYLSIDHKKALEDIKQIILISINQISNPFYFHFLYNKINDDIDDKNDEEETSQYIITYLFNILEVELTKTKLLFDEPQDLVIAQNNILLLISLHQALINNEIEIDIKMEKNIILFITYLLDNFFIYTKCLFNLNTLINNENKLMNCKSKKFFIEMITDICFYLYEKNNYDMKYQCLLENIFTNKKLNLMMIDEQNFIENKNRELYYKFFNQDKINQICKGVETPDILFSVYFLWYFCEKLNNLEQKMDEIPDVITLSYKILLFLFDEIIQLYNNYFPKISTLQKNILDNYPYRMYKSFTKFFADKYKDRNLTINNVVKLHQQLISKKDINFERSEYFSDKRTFSKTNVLDTRLLYKKNSCTNVNMFNRRLNLNFSNLNQINETDYKEKKDTPHNAIYKHYKESIIEFSFDYKKRRNKTFNNTRKNRIFSDRNLRIKSSKKMEKVSYPDSSEESDKEYKPDYKKNSADETKNNNKNDELNNDKTNEVNDKEKDKNSNNSSSDIDSNNKNEESDIGEDANENQKNADSSDEENIIEEYDVKKKLSNINITIKIYRNIFHLSDSKILKILFNPKEYYFWNKFTLVLKRIIYHNKKFGLMTNLFNIFISKKTIVKACERKTFYLNYPTKIKNFFCDDYYRPFIKPDINFFKYQYLSSSHPYLNEELRNNNYTDEDNLSNIKFERILPINYEFKPMKKLDCELINNRGSIYGNLLCNHVFLLFLSDVNSDPRNNKNLKEEEKEYYLYSYFKEEKIKTSNKYVIIYFSEIKEIFIRRFCLNYIGYEIFMKDNRHYLFNFFNRDNLKRFLHSLRDKLEITNKFSQNNNNNQIYSQTENLLSLPILNFNINNDINFNIINDPLYAFEKYNYKSKYQKGDINNFKYLLLLNKYSSRTYFDIYQYLVFPVLFLDLEQTIRRDLSKAISLNKNDNENKIHFYKENMKLIGSHFNSHYSTGGYILYYLIRLNPFTFAHIKFQSGHFDAPERIFSSLKGYLVAINQSDENRELIPELFYLGEAFINLNHNCIGFIRRDQLQINDFNSNNENGIFEFIINMRQMLEKANIAPWIDNIFGCNQINKTTENFFNIFPLSSYEQFNNTEEIKKRLEKQGKSKKVINAELEQSLCLLSLGITPAQIFKTNHPLRNTSSRLSSFLEIVQYNISNSNNNTAEKNVRAKSFSLERLMNFIEPLMNDKYQIFSLSNVNNNFGVKLLIKSNKTVNILKMFANESITKSHNIIKLDLWNKKQIKIEPFSKMCCELSPDIFILCRYIDNVLQIKSEKQTFLYQFKCIITYFPIKFRSTI